MTRLDSFAYVRKNFPLRQVTSFGVGGRAEYYACPENREQLAALLKITSAANMPVRIIGGGSNLLVSDNDISGMVLHLSGEFAERLELDAERAIVTAGSSVPMARLLHECAANNLSGLERMAGIPGSVGGAIRMNAGGADWGVGELVQSVDCFTFNGEPMRLGRPELRFSYRSSNLKNIIITAVEFSLTRGLCDSITAAMDQMRIRKSDSQPLDKRSAGCIFKNPEGDSAGRLIDAAGLKGFRIGGAAVSRKHANFIINEKNATGDDIEKLVVHIQRKVFADTGVELELEVEFWK